MCGRFSLTKEEAEIEKRFQAKFYSNDLVKRYNVAPSQLALVMTDEKPKELQLYKWGLVPSWAKEASIGYKMINARAETILEKPSFKNLIKKRRCLVISDGFYEWKQTDSKHKKPFRICLKNEGLFAFAGLWDSWTDKETGEILHSFTIITTHANMLVEPIHDRMPVILDEESESSWLDHKEPVEKIIGLLHPIQEDKLKTYEISDQVNSPKNDNSEIIEPVNADN